MIFKRKIFKIFSRTGFLPKLFLLIAVILCLPIIMVIPYPEDWRYVMSFITPAFFTALIGFLLSYKDHIPSKGSRFGKHQITVAVVGIWVFAFFIGSIPFIMSDQLGVIGSLFESVSGWTTTGLSVVYVESTPHIFLFFRSLMQFCGGLGFVLLMLLFSNGKDAMQLFTAEGHVDRLEPNLRSTAKTMMLIYLGFTSAGAIVYRLLGMAWFDAINHSMAALSTGGFSTKTSSIGYYQSLPIEFVTIILMLLGTTNFAILALLVKGRIRTIFKIGELRFFTILLIVSTFTVAISGSYGIYQSINESLRVALFQIVSALSTTGFSTVDFSKWRPDMLMIMIAMMIIGGGSGSTAGGIKYSRIYVLYKNTIAGIAKRFQPERIVNQPYTFKPQGKVYLTPQYVIEIDRFVFMYIITFLIGSILVSLSGVPFDTAIFEFASSLGTVGLSTGFTGPTTSSFVLIVEMFGMILGRLEITIVILALIAIIVNRQKPANS